MAVAQKSAISVGVLYIPSDLYKTTRDISISFNQLCKDSHERIKYKKYCPSCNKEIKSNDDIIKGYEYEKGRYVVFTQDELDKLKTEKDRTVHIDHTAKMSEIDSIYFDKNYYMIPEPGRGVRCSLRAHIKIMTSMRRFGNEEISLNYKGFLRFYSTI